LAVVLFWDQGSIPDLTLHVRKPDVTVRDKSTERNNKCVTIVTIKGVGSESERLKQEEESKILGEYRISVTLHGGFAYHLKQSQAVVAMYDFREASTQPLFISSTSVAGDMGQTWLVGSVLVGRNIFRWSQTPNVIVPSVPEDWTWPKDKGESMMRGYGLHPRRVYLRSTGGFYLSANREGSLACARAVTNGTAEGSNTSNVPGFDEAWDLDFDIDGFASLRSSHGTYLSVGSDATFTVVTADKRDESKDKFRYLLDDITSMLALVSLHPKPAYIHASPSGQLQNSDAVLCDSQEMLPGQEQSEDQSDSDENKDYDDGDDDDDDDEEDREADGGEAKDEQQKQPPQMRLPTATERWVMEAAPTRDQQQARQAHEVWTQLQANLGLLSLSSSLAS